MFFRCIVVLSPKRFWRVDCGPNVREKGESHVGAPKQTAARERDNEDDAVDHL